MFCKNCGKEIDPHAAICIHCGVKVKNSADDKPNMLLNVVSCCFPIVGLILYFVWKDEKPNSAKGVCYGALVGTALGILYYILMFILGFSSSF